MNPHDPVYIVAKGGKHLAMFEMSDRKAAIALFKSTPGAWIVEALRSEFKGK